MVGAQESTFQWQTQLKSPDVNKNMELPDVPCGHFALGTLSGMCSKDVVFEVTVRQQNFTKISKIQNCQI